MQQNAYSFKENVPYVTGLSWNSVKNDPLEIFLDKELIQNVKKQKLLGVIIDNNLSWSEQIDTVCLDITRRITLLKLLSKNIDRNSINLYYNSYIIPIFDYGCMISGRSATTNIQR